MVKFKTDNVFNIENIKLYVSTFGKKSLSLKNSRVIEVGAENRKNFIYDLKDNVGDNISNENEYYGELTGLYYIWKNENFLDNDIIGFCHYNKCLDISNRAILRFFNNKCDGKAKWIALNESYICEHPIKKELDVLCSILKNDFPQYYDTWIQIYNGEASGYKCRGGKYVHDII